jgi:hypothetical protein
LDWKGLRAQNAMEYLASHGWAIIIIMIVLAGLFYFGVFGGKNVTPRAPPGECSVYRADGAGSITSINLVGICDGELPQFVSRFNYGGSFAEFGTSNITIKGIKFMPLITNYNHNKVSMTGWIYTGPPGPVQTAFAYGNFSEAFPPYNAIFVDINQTPLCSDGMFEAIYSSYVCIYNGKVPVDTWMFVAIEYNGTQAVAYSVVKNANIVAVNSVVSSFTIPASPHSDVLIATPWNGLITNVQLYNNSLSRNEVIELYDEGLGGAPIDLKYLVGWWPMNGNLNDYSGNGNNGEAYNSASLGGAYDNNYTAP